MHCWSFNSREPTSPSPLELCSQEILAAQQSPCMYTTHNQSASEGLCCHKAILKRCHVHLMDILRSPKTCTRKFEVWSSWDSKNIMSRELRKLKNWKCTAFSSPFLPILARFSSTSRERSVSKDYGIWLTDFVLSLSLFLLNVKWPQRQYKLREQRMFQNGIYCSQATVSLFSHTTGTEARKERIKQ